MKKLNSEYNPGQREERIVRCEGHNGPGEGDDRKVRQLDPTRM